MAAPFAFFIDENYLKRVTPIDDGVEGSKLTAAMRTAQEIHILDLIGSGLYDAICNDINDNGPLTEDRDYFTLVTQYIAPCLAFYTVYEAAEMISFQFLNKGVMTRSAKDQQPASIGDIVHVANHWKRKAEDYAHKIVKYLCANPTTYPLYRNPGAAEDTVYPDESPLFGGFDLG